MPIHSVDGIVNQVGPDLIELASITPDVRQGLVIIADNLDAHAKFVSQDHQSFLDTFVNINLLIDRPIYVRIILDGRDQLRYSSGSVVDLVQHGRGKECVTYPIEHGAEAIGAHDMRRRL